MRNTSVILAIAGGMLIMVAVAAGPDGSKPAERPLGTAQESIGRTSAALGQELDTIGPGFLAEKQAIDRKAARKAPTPVGASQVQDAPLPALDTSGGQVSARSAGVPFVQAEIVDGPLPRFQIADDGLLLRPNHPPLDQIPPAPMPMTVDQRALADPGAPVFHDAITGETIVLPIDRAISSDKLGMIPGYDGADGGLGGEDRTRTFWDMYRITNTDDFPWRMNVKLVMRFVDQSLSDRWFGCSGSMIDAETVLCAGHCVYLRAVNGPDIYDWAEEIWVYPGRDGDEYPYGYGHGTHFGAWTGWTDGGSFNYDAGLIGITRAVGMLTGWFGKAWDGSCSWVLGQTYNNASYPGEDCPDPGLHTGVHMYYWYGHFDSCPGNQLQINTGGGHCFDTVWGGMSGSGAYYIDNGSRYVHAVCSNSNRTTSGRYCKLWGDWASFMNGAFIPDVRGDSFDLQALDANAEPATVPAGSALSLADFLAANPTNAAASGSWIVRTYLSTDDNISGGDTLLGTGAFPRDFGMMSSVRVSLGTPTIPISTPPGDYWFGVELDPATDGNSSNNSTDGWDAVPLTVTPAPPPNDDCGSAITIPNTPIAPYDPPQLDTRGATSAANDPLQTCTYNGPNRNSNTVWYVYTPPCDGLVNVSTCGSSYDTVVSVFTGSCGSLSEIGCNDDSCGYQSEITGLAVTGLQPIYIEVSDYNLPGGGDLDFHLDFVPTGIPSNDDCPNAQFVGIPSSTIGTTNCAMVDDYAPDCPDQAPPYNPVTVTSPGVWYRVIGTGRMLTATTCNEFSTYDTKISVYCNSCDTLTCVTGNDDDCTGYPPVRSTVSWCSQYGAEYLILVHGFYRVTGGFLLDVYQGDAPCSDAVECGGEPIGACCAPYACTEGGTCGTGFNWCGGSFDCLCLETAEGSASCTNDRACAGLTSCPNGTSDCAAGEVCYVNTCCVGPVCAPAVCAIVGSSAAATAPDGPTMGGRSSDRRGVVACEDRRQSSCEARGGLYQGDGVSCAQTYCPGPTGACCVDGTCIGTMEEPYCLRQGGEWFAGEDCQTFNCPQPTPLGACCAPWVCSEGFVCDGDNLPVCNGTFGQCFCFNTAEAGRACLDAVNQGCGEPCDATMSCPVGYVCVVDTCCEVDGERVPVCLKEGCPLSDPTGQISALGEPGPLGELSIEQPAAERGVEQQDCIDVEQAQCDSLVGLYQGDDTICEDTVCPGPPHACCLPDGQCAEASHRKCVEHGGDPQGPGTTCDMMACNPLKWAQPPVFWADSELPECFFGWDEPSVYGQQQIVADDWHCTTDLPITDIHWWGSYLQWSQTEPPQEGAPKGFHIGIWTDVAAGGQVPFSHPGKLIHEWVVDRQFLNERPVGCDFVPDHSIDTCFRYDFVIPREEWFLQDQAVEVYWISVAAIYAGCPCDGDVDGSGQLAPADLLRTWDCIGQPPTGICERADVNCDRVIDPADVNAVECLLAGEPPEVCCPAAPTELPWGWKTRPHFFHDAAVRIFAPTAPRVPAEWGEGEPIEYPPRVPWDMAFVLTTTLPEQGCCLNDGDCIDVPPHACLQLQGVSQGEGTRCTQSQACCLDDSTCIDVDPLCCDDFGGIPQGVGTQCTVEEACCLPDGTCRMLDPLCCGALNGTPQGAGMTCTEPEGCCLGNGTCLDLDPLCCDEFGGTPQGSGTACVDTTIACCNPAGASCVKTDPLCCDEMGGIPSPIGSAACLGDGDGNGVDDACEVPPQACCLRDGSCVDTDHDDCVDRGGDPQGPRTRCDGVTCQPLKWSQPPMFNPDSQYPDCFWGWDEMSIYHGQQIVADDWLCDDTQPITDIHWWGSYYRWNSPEPPDEGPTLFHIGIWTDVPAGAHGLLFSHPGKMVHEWVVDRRVLKERVVGCDFYPERPRDTCFRYDFIIPREKWFFQEAACEIYWVSIAAIYPDDYFGLSFWGWKTRKYRFGDTAVRVFSPTGPRVPDEFNEGQPIEDPLHVPWDMAFVLTTTRATEACCLQDQSCLDVVREVCMEMGGKPQGRDTECTQPQACCLDDGTCIDIDPLCCDEFGGTPLGLNTQCTVEQACCLPDATCQVLDPLCCRNMGGRPQGAGTDCTEPEACCLRDGKCLDVDPLCCDEFGGEPQGSGTACEGDLDGNGIDEACELDDVCEDCGTGPHWVDQCAAGSDDMPSGALVGIDLDLDCQADVSMVLSGAVKIVRSDPLDVSAQFANVGTLDDHTDVIDTEIVSMSLANLATGVILTAGAGTGHGGVLGPSLGAIIEQAGDPALADSFFDILFEVSLDDDLYVYNHTPLRVDTKIICVPPDATYIHPVGCIPLYDTPLPDQGTVVANLVTADHSTYPGCGDPTTGDCFDPNNGTPYCDDAECCEAVCQQLPHCCELIWDTDCTGVAVEVCHTIEACCLPDGQCTELTPTDCRALFGIPQGPGTTCADVDCPLPPVIEIDPFYYSIGEFEVSGPFGTEIIHVSGPAKVYVFFEGSTLGTANDDDTDGFDEVTIQMVDLNLTGLSPLLGPVHVTLNPNLPSFGEIEETANNTHGILDLPPFAPTGTANSYFNLFFKIEVGGQTYFTIDPKQMRSVITHKPPGPTDIYQNLDRIELYDENGDPTGIFLDASRHRPNPPEACCLPDGRCREIPVGECLENDGLPLGPATLCEGDSNQDGIDDACEEEHACADCGPGDHWVDQCPGGNDNMPTSAIVGIDLNGDCQPDASMVLSGPVSIWRSNPRDASWQFMGVGALDSHTDVIDTEIVSMSLTNAAAGVTFTVGAGLGQGGALPASFGAILEQEGDPTMADSFFDVFFEADLGGGMYAYNHVPLRVSTKINCLPPNAVYIHPVVCIPLFDAAGNQVGNLVTADHSTYPECGDPTTGNCFEPNGTPYCDDAECCRAVCEQLPHCCDVAWDQHCAAAAQEICRPCPPAGIIESSPPNGVVDARQPNTPRDSLPRQGIGTEEEPIVVALDPPITDAANCFNLCETAADQILGVNYIVSVSGSGTGQYKIVLHHAITAGAVTTIQYKGGGSYVEFTSHPANVNADSATAPSDILRVIDYINGVATSPWGIYSEDVDRSNLLGPPDILRVIDLLNGAGVFNSWLNSPLPVNTSCP